MVRIKQTSRKSVGGTAPSLRCVYAIRPKKAGAAKGRRTRKISKTPKVPKVDDSSSDDGSFDVDGPDDRLVPSSLQQACNGCGHVEPCNDLQLDLDPETVHALSQMQQVSDRDNWPGIKGLAKGWPTKLCIHKEVGRQDVYVPVTTKTIRKLVGCVAGTLMERYKFEKIVVPQHDARHKMAYAILSKDLHDEYGYPANGPDLVLSSIVRMQHGTWRTRDITMPSPGWLSAITRLLGPPAAVAPLPVPLIAVYSSRRIAKGLELRMDWGGVMWERYHQIKVIKQGGANHQLHLKLQRLDQLLQTAQSKIPQAKRHSKRMRLEDADPTSPAKSDWYLGFKPHTDKWYWEQPDSTNGSEPNGAVHHEEDSFNADADADDSSTSEAGTSSAAAEAQQSFRVLSEQEVASVFPGLRDTHNFSHLPEPVLDLFDELHAEQLSAGSAVQSLPAAKAQVAEVVDMQHPVRWCTSPDERAYTLVASADIAKNEPIIDYVICYKAGAADVKKPLDAAYTYGIDKKTCGSLDRPAGNCLLITSRWAAFRASSTAAGEGRSRLRGPRPIPIPVGEELVVDYGPHHWGVVARALMIAQHEHAAKALALEERLVRELQLCARRGLLTREVLDPAQTFEPNVRKVQFYGGPGST